MTDQTSARDLSFRPIVNSRPRVLTQTQIARYNEQGYLKPFAIYSLDEAASIRAYVDSLLARVAAADDGRDAYSINGFHTKCRGLWDIVMEPRIFDLVEDITGPDFVCWGTHLFCKMPGDPKIVPWHQDASYWPFDTSRTVTVWLAIDNADIENGCMQVLPATHKMGALPWEETQHAAVLNQEITGVEKYGRPEPFELKAGTLSLHADMLAHGSEPNLSTRRRCGLTIRYCPVSVRSDAGWNRQAILCRGADPDGHWSDHPRPEGDDISPMTWQIHAG